MLKKDYEETIESLTGDDSEDTTCRKEEGHNTRNEFDGLYRFNSEELGFILDKQLQGVC